MDGAVEAGERAAREVLHARGKIPENQICQTEPVSEVKYEGQTARLFFIQPQSYLNLKYTCKNYQLQV